MTLRFVQSLSQLVRVEETRSFDRGRLLAIQLAAIRRLGSVAYTRAELRAWCDLAAEESSERPPQFRTFLARLEGRLTGFGRVDVGGYIGALYVEPGGVRRGVGTALVRAMERSVQAGSRQLQLDASLNAVRFYRRRGFVAIDDAFLEHPSGLRLAVVRMVKLIGARAPSLLDAGERITPGPG